MNEPIAKTLANNEIGIPQQGATDLSLMLNDLLSNYAVYYQNLRGFHWNITGKAFFELHAKFEELYTGANLAIDEIAERILTLGASPLHTFTDFIERSEVREAKGVRNAEDSVSTVISNLGVLLEKERAIMKSAAEADDEGTADLMSDYIREQEKTLWMLRAYLR